MSVESLVERFDYKKTGLRLPLQAFLQHIIAYRVADQRPLQCALAVF